MHIFSQLLMSLYLSEESFKKSYGGSNYDTSASNEQARAFKQLAKAFNIPFETVKEKSPYSTAFVEKIKKGERAAKAGKGMQVNMENLWDKITYTAKP